MPGNWTRVHGEGEPTDYSAGASTEGDYSEATAQPFDRPITRLRLLDADAPRRPAEPPPVDATYPLPSPPRPVPDALRPFSPVEPSPAIRRPRINFAEGLRLFARHVASKEGPKK